MLLQRSCHHGMVKVLGRISRHADFFHDASGPDVVHRGKAHNLAQAKHLKAGVQCGMRRLSSQPLAPVGSGKTPTNLHTGRKVTLKARHI